MNKKLFFLILTLVITVKCNEPFNFLGLPKEIQREIISTLQSMKSTRKAFKTFGRFLCTSKNSLKLFNVKQKQQFFLYFIERHWEDNPFLWELFQEMELKSSFKVILRLPKIENKINEIEKTYELMVDKHQKYLRVNCPGINCHCHLCVGDNECENIFIDDDDY